jgi:hypothetical protein
MNEIEVFQKDLGAWDAEITVNTPNGPQKSRGSMSGRMLGGRWLVLDFENDNGFEGHGVYGWDPDAKSYVGAWIDSARPFLVTGRGDWQPETRTMTFRYEHQMNGKPMSWREVTTTNPDGTQTFRVIMKMPDGNEAVMLEALYTKQAGG